MKYSEFVGKNIKINLKDGRKFTGIVDGYSDAEDNQRPFDSIEIWSNGKGLGFYEDEIESIEIINA